MMMSHRLLAALSLLLLGACSSASSQDTASDPSMGATPEPSTAPADGDSPNAPGKDPEREFTLQDSETAGSAHGEGESTLKPTTTEAVVKFVVVDKETNDRLTGIVISLADEAGATFYTKETDGTSYAEVLVPVGHQYDLVYLSLGRRNVSARVPVTDEPKQNIKLTLRYKSR